MTTMRCYNQEKPVKGVKMRYIVPMITAILMLGCSGNTTEESAAGKAVEETPKTEAAMPAAPDAKKVKTPAVESLPGQAPEPSGIDKTIAPAFQPKSDAVDGAVLYAKKCASCHGQKGEKKALNKSQVIAGWENSKVEEALKGYKEGTYGGAMKALMQGQVKTLSDEEVSALAHYIGSL